MEKITKKNSLVDYLKAWRSYPMILNEKAWEDKEHPIRSFIKYRSISLGLSLLEGLPLGYIGYVIYDTPLTFFAGPWLTAFARSQQARSYYGAELMRDLDRIYHKDDSFSNPK